MTVPTPDELVTGLKADPESGIERDRWGRPLILQQDGSKVAYRRASSVSEALTGGGGALIDWVSRLTAWGVANSPDIIRQLAGVPEIDSKENKSLANRLAKEASERAGRSYKAQLGTALHAATEHWDQTGELAPNAPEQFRPLLESYGRVTAGIRWYATEQFVVDDELQVAGTADRYGVLPNGTLAVFDVKTGSLYAPWKFAMQLASYAHGQLYDPATGARTPVGNVDRKVGFIIHMPADGQECRLHAIDLEYGRVLMRAAKWVLEMQRNPRRYFMEVPPPGGSAGQ